MSRVAPMPGLYRFTPLMRLPLRQRRRARPGATAHNPNLAGAMGHSPRTVRLIPRREHAERGKVDLMTDAALDKRSFSGTGGGFSFRDTVLQCGGHRGAPRF